MGPCASPGCVRRYWVDNESMLSHCVIRMRATAACREHTTHGHRPAITITQAVNLHLRVRRSGVLGVEMKTLPVNVWS